MVARKTSGANIGDQKEQKMAEFNVIPGDDETVDTYSVGLVKRQVSVQGKIQLYRAREGFKVGIWQVMNGHGQIEWTLNAHKLPDHCQSHDLFDKIKVGDCIDYLDGCHPLESMKRFGVIL